MSDEAKKGAGKEPAPKRPVGRPSEYDPSMLDKIIEIGKIGGSQVEMAVEIGVSRETFYRWKDELPEFCDTVKKALDLSQSWWEKQGRVATFAGDGFNATSYIFNMKNRFKEDWRDKVETEHSGKVEGLAINIDLGDLS